MHTIHVKTRKKLRPFIRKHTMEHDHVLKQKLHAQLCFKKAANTQWQTQQMMFLPLMDLALVRGGDTTPFVFISFACLSNNSAFSLRSLDEDNECQCPT